MLDSSDIEVHQIDVSKRSSDVSFNGKVLDFGLPLDLLARVEPGYKLIVDAGVVNSKSNCGVESMPYELDLQSLGMLF